MWGYADWSLCAARAISACVGLAASDIDIPADGFFRRAELGFRLFHQRDDLLRPLAEKHTFLRQRNLPFPAQEQRFPQFLLKLHHLPRQRGLGDVQASAAPDMLSSLATARK